MSRHANQVAGTAVLALSLALPSFGAEGYRVEGTVHDDFPSIAGKVAILPPLAPKDLDLEWLERKLSGQTALRPKAPLVRLSDVKDAIARLGIDPAPSENRKRLAVELGVDSFLEIRISDLAAWKSSNAFVPEGGTKVGKQKTDSARAKVVLRICSSASNTTWFEGTTEGSALARGIEPLLSEMLDRLFEKAYPARRYR